MKKLLKKERNTSNQRAGDWQWIHSIQNETQSKQQLKKGDDHKIESAGDPLLKLPPIGFAPIAAIWTNLDKKVKIKS